MDMGDEPGQAQSQSQSVNNQQQFTFNIATSNPELERRIFSGVHSPGRQLDRMGAVIEALIAAVPGLTGDVKAANAVDEFQKMQRDILREKHRGNPRYLVEQLNDLQRADPATFAAVTAELRVWLNTLPPG
jgi:hypothetical protein